MAFKKGESGNPKGRPKKAKLFETALMMELKAAGEEMPELRQIARNLIDLSKVNSKDALPAINALVDRTDGKVPQALVGDDDDGPVKMLLEVAWKAQGSKDASSDDA